MKLPDKREHKDNDTVDNHYLSLIFQNTSDLFCLLEVHKNNELFIISVNPSYVNAAKEFNPNMSAQTFIGRSVAEVMREDYQMDEHQANEVLDEYERTLKIRRPRTFTEEIEFNGIVRHYSSTITPILDKDGNCSHLLYSSKDISEKINYERALVSKETKFRALIENSHECIAIFDAIGHIIYISPSITSMAGYKEQDFKGPRLNFVHPEDAKTNILKFNQVLENPSAYVSFRFRLRHARGHYIWIEATLTNLLDKPEVGGIVSNFRDITAHKFAEDQIRETSQLLESINQNIVEGICRIIPDHNFTYVNQAFLEMFGYESLEALNKSGTTSLYETAAVRKEVQNQLIKDKKISNVEIKFKKKDGTVFWGLLSASLIEINEYERYIDGAVRDITQLKSAEEKLTRLNSELQKQNIALAKREEDLNIALQELSDRNFELDQLVYKTSHDLRSPLNSVLGLVNIAKLDSEDIKEQHLEYLNRIEQSILKLDDFVKSMLDFAKASRTEVEIKPTELKELLENCIQDLEYLENFHKIKTSIDLEGKENSFCSDPLRLKIIFSNIISNAYKYYNPNRENSFLQINVVFKSSELLITFKDNGIGIDKKEMSRIYDMFYRATDVSEGSGLGMYIVKQSVHKLGGTIKVESTLNEGTLFTVSIPGR